MAVVEATEQDALRARCTRFLNWHGNRSAQEYLAEIPLDAGIDRYGAGGAVTELETEVSALLGKPSAVFMPSGTMAQQSALRIHCDQKHIRAFGFHPTSHLELHEDKAYQRMHGLVGVRIGDPRALISLVDLQAVTEPLAAVLFELPQREIGGVLPSWAELETQIAYVHDRGAATHLDGARLWECTPYYGKELREIAALFDTVYVSFYKGLGGLSGCCLAGDEEMVAQARAWRHRHGGTLWSLWPLAASGLAGLRTRLPRIPRYCDHALAIADALRGLAGVEVVPDPPQTPMMHLHLRVDPKRFDEGIRALAENEGVWAWGRSFPADTPSIQIVELTVGDATLEFSPEEVATIVGRLTPEA